LGLPPGPTSPGFPDSGGATTGKASRALIGDLDSLSRVSPDGTDVALTAIGAAVVLVGAPPKGYVRCVQRALVCDVVAPAAASTVELYLTTDLAAGATYQELLDRDRADVLAGGASLLAKAKLSEPIMFRENQALWCNASIAGEAFARYFDILLKD